MCTWCRLHVHIIYRPYIGFIPAPCAVHLRMQQWKNFKLIAEDVAIALSAVGRSECTVQRKN